MYKLNVGAYFMKFSTTFDNDFSRMFNRAITAPNNTDERGIIWDYVQTDVIMDMISLGYGRHDERLEQAFDDIFGLSDFQNENENEKVYGTQEQSHGRSETRLVMILMP